MNLWTFIARRVKRAIYGAPPRKPRAPKQPARVAKSARVYPLVLGLTARTILLHLERQDMTRREIDLVVAPMTTASHHLGYLRSWGLVSASGWPFVYTITDDGVAALRIAETQR